MSKLGREPRVCIRCGAALGPDDGSDGHCPRCLMRLALDGGDTSEPSPAGTATSPVPAADIKGLSLSPGDRLGGYEVVAGLGRGGMGEVYRARDLTLEREVAIKILPGELDAQPEHLERFEREAKVLASLNHPNIATLFGYEREDDLAFLIMELVEGETMADRLDRGPLPWHEALSLFLQIARGLEAAHEQGIVHRDLKPSNVEVSDGRTAKLLDFGLARGFAERDSSSGSPLTKSPTLTYGLTRSGMILGTAGYMSPEQAKGRIVDKRCDIWAFGCCLFEALVGRQPFGGDSVSETIANLLKDEPNWGLVPSDVPPALVRLLRRCLEKDVHRRMRDIGDAAFEIEEMLSGDLDQATTVPPSSQPKGKGRVVVSRLAWAAAGLAGGLLSGLFMAGVWPGAEPAVTPGEAAVRRFMVPMPEVMGGIHSLALSRDGRLVVVAPVDSHRPLQLRRLVRNTSEPIPGTVMGEFPFFSPDGSRVGFFSRSDNHLKVAPVGGGPVTVLAEDLVRNWGGSWGDDGFIVFHSQSGGNGLSRMAATGGDPEVLTLPDREKSEESHRWPQVLPGSRWVVFTIWGGSDELARVALFSREDGSVRELADGTYARYLPSGHLLFFQGSRPLLAPFDAEEGRLAGLARPLAEIEATGPWGQRQVAIADDGLLVRGMPALNRPVWLDLDGELEEVGIPPGHYRGPALSSAGDRLAISLTSPGEWADIWIFDLDEQRKDRLTFTGINESPVWVEGDTSVVFWSERNGTRTLYRRRVDGGGEAEALVDGAHGRPVAATADGAHVTTNHAGDVWLVATDGSDARALYESPFLAGNAAFSPDGSSYAFMSLESGYFQAYISRVDGSTGRVPISQGIVVDLLWSPSGEIILYRSEEKIFRVDVELTPRLRVGVPVMVAEDSYTRTTGRDWAFAPDGRRVLVLAEAEPARLFLAEHWLSEATGTAASP